MRRYPFLALMVALLALVFADTASAVYHPGLGRYVQRDPNGIQASTSTASRPTGAPAVSGGFIQRDFDPHQQYADGGNLYQYVRSSPVNRLDPQGLESLIFAYTTRIEVHPLQFPEGVPFLERRFNGGMKTNHVVRIDLENCESHEVQKYVGETIEYDNAGNEIGRGQGTGATLKHFAGQSDEIDPCVCVFWMEGDEGNPLVAGAPGITYTAAVTIDKRQREYDWMVRHDRFPSHTFSGGAGGVLHEFSHLQEGTSPASLFAWTWKETNFGTESY